MNITGFVKKGEVIVHPDNDRLVYSGRIGTGACGYPEFVFPGTSVRLRFKGTGFSAVVSSERFYWDVFAGCIIDGTEYTMKLPDADTEADESRTAGDTAGRQEADDADESRTVCGTAGRQEADDVDESRTVCISRIDVAAGLPDCEHTVTFFKRQDACNVITIYALILSEESRLLDPPPVPSRRMEIYGDSVSAGEVSEAVDHVGMPDPEGHEGRFSNSRYSYGSLTAELLGAELHNISQGGVALMPGTGWFGGPDYIGMEQIYDKLRYYPELQHATAWDFRKYIPHVVVVAIGQNDAHPVDHMKEDYDGESSEKWRRHYAGFLGRLRGHYPKALIVCTTTILEHDPSWDRAIEEAVTGLGDPGIKHFMYTRNGSGTPGHIRIPEAEEMAGELAAYIKSFGDGIWEE